MAQGSEAFERAVKAARVGIVEWLDIEPDAEDIEESTGAARVALHAAVPHLLAPLRELAQEWASQSNDYDEDTEQQILDGRNVLRVLNQIEATR